MSMVRQSRSFAAALAGALLLAAAPVRAQEMPAATQAVLLLRVLAYDHNLATRAGGSAVIDIVYRPGVAESESVQGEMAATLRDLAGKTSLSGLPIRVNVMAFGPGFDGQIGTTRAAALYLCPGLGDVVPAIARATAAHSVLSFSGTDSDVQAVSVALVTHGGRPAILLNLQEVRAEGADLDASLVRLAEIAKR